MRSIAVRHRTNCPFSAAMEFARDLLGADARIRITPLPGPGERVALHTELTDDVSDPVRRHDALLLSWTPAHRLFPDLHGALTARPHGRYCTLQLRADYAAPFGAAGRIFDAIVGRAVAYVTLRRFLSRLAGSIERRWTAARASLESPPR